ncbi:hypothetical protein NIES4101_82620 [Calothrix sp. NIES-4101]|nr:hypothetical protein NIES4101_82620 [Calothrix sp. NIES-4101]
MIHLISWQNTLNITWGTQQSDCVKKRQKNITLYVQNRDSQKKSELN